MFPTIVDIVGLPKRSLLKPFDGVSLKPSIEGSIPKSRKQPIPFRYMGKGAIVDNDYKLVVTSVEKKTYELYDLAKDPDESQDIYDTRPEVAKRLTKAFEKWNRTVEASDAGKDYPEGKLTDPNPRRIFWTELPDYEPYFQEWKNRPEYESRLKGK